MVCLGNICRSPMAEYMLRDAAVRAGVDIEVESAGVSAEVGNRATREARQVLAENGINADAHIARMLTEQMLIEADLVLVATESLKRRVMNFANASESKVRLMLGDRDLADPWGLTMRDYRETAEQLQPVVDDLVALVGGSE